ncbi:O-acyltransferase WSD1 [Theobroma cacao]|nr:O-acyltransferase WSD1 [Theobroma cacao]
MSLLISCSRKLSDPLALLTFPAMKKKPMPTTTTTWLCFWIRLWSFFLLIWNTSVDLLVCVATLYFYKDTPTPLKPSSRRVACTPGRIVRRTFTLDDIKLVKNGTNMTVNDVVLGITQAGLSRYLNRKYGKTKRNEAGREWEDNLPNNIRLRATLFINLRSSPGIYYQREIMAFEYTLIISFPLCKMNLQALGEMLKKNSKAEWGNKIGYVLFPFMIALKDNPLDYIRDVKVAMDRKKASLEAKFRLLMAMVFVRFYCTRV